MKKQVVIFAFCALCCGLFVLYSDPALEAARQGFYLWRDAVLPALLPFLSAPISCKTAGPYPCKTPCSSIPSPWFPAPPPAPG